MLRFKLFSTFAVVSLVFFFNFTLQGQTLPHEINFVRQAAQRMIFDENQSILLARLDPAKIVGMSAMHPARHYLNGQSDIRVKGDKLVVSCSRPAQTAIWFGGFNPFATYTINLSSCSGVGEIGFEFSDADHKEQFLVTAIFGDSILQDVKLKIKTVEQTMVDESIFVVQEAEGQAGTSSKKDAVAADEGAKMRGKLILQMLGSGLVVYLQHEGLPQVIGQSDFNQYIDLRSIKRISSFQSALFLSFQNGEVGVNKVEAALSTGVGLADIRPISYENGDPLLDQGRLWYTMSIRGRGLPHHLQGVFSLNPTVFDLKLEGVILFDRNDGLWRNEIASHIFYDRKAKCWRGITTGFSAYANPDKEKKQLLAVESTKDPRFGFSVMKAVPFGVVGDIEDPHILFDEHAKKWRILTCENHDGYKAVMLESEVWNKGYQKISGPVSHNSTGTSIQRINGRYYCFSGSAEGKIFIYTYPDLKEAGNLKMDLPPWDISSGTRVWPNVVQLPEGYPFRFAALMMDRYNYPGLQGPNWSYGALYLYHGN
ncbi:hypothetical protein PBAL39_00455 [Pedobacter sp. BAL39]|uniref:hypothetical protein n=1 Tax=Pedobacter sp. BAL39 TaxID=391596 RepID=UPI000155925A|nr:hypothetical protein [Pedobacter sp. BAL39]EDM34957.1 hypothetical protein PBAL39_00455 [Pedobacter sp. BAL39]